MTEVKNDPSRKIGIVRKRLDTIGFIAVFDEDADRFFHFSGMSPESLKPFHHLHIGDKVTFLPIVGKDGKPQAIDIRSVIVKRVQSSKPS